MLCLKRFIFCLTLCFLYLNMFFVAWSSDFYFSSFLNFKNCYDDNVAFTYYSKEDFYLTTSSAFFSTYKTEILSISSRVRAESYNYLSETRLNTFNYSLEFRSTYWRNSRLNFSLDGSVVKDTTLESELKETGIVRFRQDRHRYIFSPGISYYLTPLSQILFNFSASRTEYEWKYSVDYNDYLISTTFKKALRNERVSFLSQIYYHNIDSENSQVRDKGFMVGWERLLSYNSKVTFYLGIRYTSMEYYRMYASLSYLPYWPFIKVYLLRRSEKDNEWGSLVDLSWEKKNERTQYRLGINKSLSYSSFGQTIDRWKISTNITYLLTPRWRFKFSLFYANTSSDGQVYEEKNTFYSFNPRIIYSLKERWLLEVAYKYSRFRNRVTDRDYDRNQIWVGLTFKFGKPSGF